MRIGIISVIEEPWGGSEELWAAMAERALAEGHEVIYCTLDFPLPASRVAKMVEQGLQLVPRKAYVRNGEAPWKRRLKKGWYLLRAQVANPFSDFFDKRPDIILYNGTSLSLLEHPELATLWERYSGIRVVLAHFIPEHNALLAKEARHLLRRFFTLSNAALFVSSRSQAVTERVLACSLPQAHQVRNPVNMAEVTALPFPPQQDYWQLAMVGNLVCVHKGQDTMLQVLAQEKWRKEPWHLNIYGAGMDRDYLEELVALYGFSDRVTFHGKVGDIRQLWSHNHLLLMPSVMEGMPLAVVEAMLCGRPVLATDVGGHAEWITDGVEGFLAAASSISSLEATFARAWQTRHLWADMGVKAHQKAVLNYDAAPGETLLRLLEALCVSPK